MAGVITVNIGGKERSLKFGTNSTAHYCEVRGCTLNDYVNDLSNLILSSSSDIDEDIKAAVQMNGSEVRDLIYSSIWAFDMTNDNIVDYDRLKVGDWIDDIDQKDLNRIFTELFNSSEGKVKPKESKVEGEKKK